MELPAHSFRAPVLEERCSKEVFWIDYSRIRAVRCRAADTLRQTYARCSADRQGEKTHPVRHSRVRLPVCNASVAGCTGLYLERERRRPFRLQSPDQAPVGPPDSTSCYPDPQTLPPPQLLPGSESEAVQFKGFLPEIGTISGYYDAELLPHIEVLCLEGPATMRR